MQLQLLTKEDLSSLEDKINTIINFFENRNTDRVYSSEQLAKKLQVSTKTLNNWRKQKLIQFSQVGSKIFYTQEAVDDFLSSHSIKRFSSLR
jgi:phage antirepressor YoqD-like protein